jgi:isopenicillin N synthase-like dioxygenase
MAQTTATQLGPNAVAAPTATASDEDPGLAFDDLPPFPDDVPTAPLLRLSLKKLLDNDAAEIERLWRTSCDIGFFYLDLRDAVEDMKRDSAQDLTAAISKEGKVDGEALLKDANAMFELGPKVFALPYEEKIKYDYAGKDSYFGYKPFRQGITDSAGTRDWNEFWNVSKNDILGQVDELDNPDLLRDGLNRDVIRDFMLRSHAVTMLVLRLLNDKLDLPPQTLQSLHRVKGISGDQTRWVWSIPQPVDERVNSIGAHTDFGTFTVLFNRLGGLQVQMPDTSDWCYVKPLKGHCVCNLGDSASIFSAGILRSNLHRVVNPPGEQAESTRLSVVYFNRPEDEVVLKALEGSEMIEDRLSTKVTFQGQEYITAKEWIIRRAHGRRIGGDCTYTNSKSLSKAIANPALSQRHQRH